MLPILQMAPPPQRPIQLNACKPRARNPAPGPAKPKPSSRLRSGEVRAASCPSRRSKSRASFVVEALNRALRAQAWRRRPSSCRQGAAPSPVLINVRWKEKVEPSSAYRPPNTRESEGKTSHNSQCTQAGWERRAFSCCQHSALCFKLLFFAETSGLRCSPEDMQLTRGAGSPVPSSEEACGFRFL